MTEYKLFFGLFFLLQASYFTCHELLVIQGVGSCVISFDLKSDNNAKAYFSGL